MAVQIVYETHSTTLDNEAGIATGWLPGELSPAGMTQAKELGRRRRDDGIDVVLCSDLRRAVDTAELAFGDTDVPIRLDRRLRECDYGTLNGAAVDLLKSRVRFIDTPFPGGESYTDVVARTAGLLGDLAAQHDGERVMLIAHSANRWALQVLLTGATLDDLVDADFAWQPGWELELPSGWTPSQPLPT